METKNERTFDEIEKIISNLKYQPGSVLRSYLDAARVIIAANGGKWDKGVHDVCLFLPEGKMKTDACALVERIEKQLQREAGYPLGIRRASWEAIRNALSAGEVLDTLDMARIADVSNSTPKTSKWIDHILDFGQGQYARSANNYDAICLASSEYASLPTPEPTEGQPSEGQPSESQPTDEFDFRLGRVEIASMIDGWNMLTDGARAEYHAVANMVQDAFGCWDNTTAEKYDTVKRCGDWTRAKTLQCNGIPRHKVTSIVKQMDKRIRGTVKRTDRPRGITASGWQAILEAIEAGEAVTAKRAAQLAGVSRSFASRARYLESIVEFGRGRYVTVSIPASNTRPSSAVKLVK